MLLPYNLEHLKRWFAQGQALGQDRFVVMVDMFATPWLDDDDDDSDVYPHYLKYDEPVPGTLHNMQKPFQFHDLHEDLEPQYQAFQDTPQPRKA
jgi:hypothetical protein